MDDDEVDTVIAENKMPRPHARTFKAAVQKLRSLAARDGPKQEEGNSTAKANAKNDPPTTAKQSENDQAAIVVRTLTGAKLEISGMNGSSKIAEVKASVKQQHGIPVDEQRLVLSGNELKDWRTLADYRITGKSDLHLVLRAPPTGEERARLARERKAEEALASAVSAAESKKPGGCPNRSNPHHACNDYCVKRYGKAPAPDQLAAAPTTAPAHYPMVDASWQQAYCRTCGETRSAQFSKTETVLDSCSLGPPVDRARDPVRGVVACHISQHVLLEQVWLHVSEEHAWVWRELLVLR